MVKVKCNECGKSFKSEEGLNMHKKALHSENKGVSYGKIRNWLLFLAIIALMSWGIYAFIDGQDKYDGFAECLTESGAKMYGAYWCAACIEQKRMFGNSWDRIEYIECSLPNNAGQTQECISEGIQSYPTWEFADGSRLSGVLTEDQLRDKTGCLVE